MNKKIILTLLASLSTVFFTACSKNQDPEPSPTPEPTQKDVAIRFYTTKGATDFSTIKFYGKYNGASDYLELTDVKKAEYVAEYDEYFKDAIKLSLSTDEMVIYQAKLKLDNGEHQFKMNFNYNGASYKEGQEIDLYIGSCSIVETYRTGNMISTMYGGVKVASLQTFVNEFVNDKHILKVELK